MNKEEMNAKIDALSAKMKEAGGKAVDSINAAQKMISDSVDAAQNKAADTLAAAQAKGQALQKETKEKLDAQIADAQKNIDDLRTSSKQAAEKIKGDASAQMMKAQQSMEEAKANIADKKVEHDKAKFAQYIEDTMEYAMACAQLSELAAEESKLATLEAMSAQAQYDEQYPDSDDGSASASDAK